LETFLQETREKGKWANNAVILANGEIVEPRMKGGLRPTAVTRDLTWGVPVPSVGDEKEDEAMKGKVMCTLLFLECSRIRSTVKAEDIAARHLLF